jgi:SAM-dependent methyltransferase
MTDRLITPEETIAALSVDQLCQTAEDYYASLTDYTYHMAKPFGSVKDAPQLLYNLALLLSGLRLGPTMTVLDFGGGTGWLSRFLNQLRCATICVDPSPTTLRIGEELFERLPVLGGVVEPPRFLPFDGHRIDLPDSAVDRIICFDAFHHVPNPNEVLEEFYRVLKDGGVVGFSEPGRFHSRSPQSQYEMRNFAVLENDIRLDELKPVAEAIGFGELRIKLVQSLGDELDYADYLKVTKWRYLPLRLWSAITSATRQSTIFYFTKGTFHSDSRSSTGLSHKIEVLDDKRTVQAGNAAGVVVRLANTGTSTWLHENRYDYGVVKIGAHLYDASGTLLDLDFARSSLPAEVSPGAALEVRLPLVFPQPGSYQVAIDLVSERIAWFENLGSQPQLIRVTVEDAGPPLRSN